MVKFIRSLRLIHMTVFDKRFNLLRLEEHPDWDNTFDTGDFKILASWFYTHNTTVDSFNRDSMLQYDDFCFFRTQYKVASPDPNVPPGITDDEIVTPAWWWLLLRLLLLLIMLILISSMTKLAPLKLYLIKSLLLMMLHILRSAMKPFLQLTLTTIVVVPLAS